MSPSYLSNRNKKLICSVAKAEKTKTSGQSERVGRKLVMQLGMKCETNHQPTPKYFSGSIWLVNTVYSSKIMNCDHSVNIFNFRFGAL